MLAPCLRILKGDLKMCSFLRAPTKCRYIWLCIDVTSVPVYRLLIIVYPQFTFISILSRKKSYKKRWYNYKCCTKKDCETTEQIIGNKTISIFVHVIHESTERESRLFVSTYYWESPLRTVTLTKLG